MASTASITDYTQFNPFSDWATEVAAELDGLLDTPHPENCDAQNSAMTQAAYFLGFEGAEPTGGGDGSLTYEIDAPDGSTFSAGLSLQDYAVGEGRDLLADAVRSILEGASDAEVTA